MSQTEKTKDLTEVAATYVSGAKNLEGFFFGRRIGLAIAGLAGALYLGVTLFGV
jgi:hypothetical protein